MKGKIWDAWLPWSKLRGVGNSPIVRITVLIPVVGYLIIFNKNVADFLHLASQFVGVDDEHFGVAPKLMLVYVGLCATALGVVVFSAFCPADVKYYGTPNAYVLGDGQALKDFELEKIETLLKRSKAYSAEVMRMRNRYERLGGPPITDDQKRTIDNGLLHLYFRYQNNSRFLWRWLAGLAYAIGFVCLLIPSAGVFWRVIKIIVDVAEANVRLLF